MEQNRNLILQWIQKAGELEPGEEILLPAETRRDQKEKRNLFLRELKILSKVDPIAASELQVIGKFEDHRFWVCLKRVVFSPLIAFKKDNQGIVERIIVEDNSERKRRLLLMIKDGYSIEEIEELEGNLTTEDLELLKRGEEI